MAVYRQLIDGSVYEWGASQTSPLTGSATVTLTGGHSVAPTIVLNPAYPAFLGATDYNSNVNLVSVTKDVFMVESSDPGVVFAYYAVSKP
jgi:hypothetical protein